MASVNPYLHALAVAGILALPAPSIADSASVNFPRRPAAANARDSSPALRLTATETPHGPAEFSLLPESLKVTGSERYWSEGFLDQPYLSGVVSAQYHRANGRLCTLFVMTCPSESAAVQALESITDTWEEEIPRVKAFASRNRVGGCVGCTRREHETVLFGMLLQALRGR